MGLRSSRSSRSTSAFLAATLALSTPGAGSAAAVAQSMGPGVTVDVGLNPHQIVFADGGGEAFVAAAGSDRITVLDRDPVRVTATVPAPGTPLGVALLDGGSLAVSRFGSDRLVRVALNGGTVLDELEVGGAPSLLVGPVADRWYLVSSESTDRLLLLDGRTFSLAGSVPVGDRPFPPAATSDGRFALVPGYDDGTVTRVDLTRGSADWTVAVGRRPSGGAVLPGDTLYLAALRGENRLALVDVRNGAIRGHVEEGIGQGPFSVVTSPRLRVAFVNNTSSHDVSVVDLASLTVVERVAVPEIPIVMAVAPDGGSLWVSSEGQDGLTVLPVPAPYRRDAQQAPGTDIWTADLAEEGGEVRLDGLRRVTDRPGYDNQPHLLPDGTLLYTSIDDAGQADIWQVPSAGGGARPFTRTAPESEYSATLMPGGQGISVIRVEADSTQRLWRFDRSGGDPAVLVPGVAPAGYHAWVDESRVALFVLGSPPTLQIADLGTATARTVAQRVGRSLHRVPGSSRISFVQFDTDGENGFIRTVDPGSGAMETLTEVRPGSQDYAWTPGGTLLMAQGSVLYRWTPAHGWRTVADLAAEGLTDVSRLAVSPDGTRIALVGAR